MAYPYVTYDVRVCAWVSIKCSSAKKLRAQTNNAQYIRARQERGLLAQNLSSFLN